MKIDKSADLILHWSVVGLMLTTLVIFLFVSHKFGHELAPPLPEHDRMIIRSVFYVIAIIFFPLTNLVRHIHLRLNQTMPGDGNARSRYLLTVIVSMLFVETIGVLGFVIFMLGDDFNTLYIFIGLSCLGTFLYRPKLVEYESIVDSLSINREPFEKFPH